MTIFGFKLLEKAAYVLTNTQVLEAGNGEDEHHIYKPFITENMGLFFGPDQPFMVELIHSYILKNKSSGFDELVLQLPGLIKKAMYYFISGMAGLSKMDIPKKWTEDHAIKVFKNHPLLGRTIDSDFFFVGYSENRKSMAAVFCGSESGHQAIVFYQADRAGFYFFPPNSLLFDYVKSLNRNPESIEELSHCLRLVFQAESEKIRNKADVTVTIPPGGDIHLTTWNMDGSLRVDNLGPVGNVHGRAETAQTVGWVH